MKGFALRGSGDRWNDTISLLNMHLHPVTAKNEVTGVPEPSRPDRTNAYKFFFSKIAEYILTFKCRFAIGDLSIAFYRFIPELRARGFQVQLAGWNCYQFIPEIRARTVRSDSCGIWVTGTHQGVKLCMDCRVFGYNEPGYPDHTCALKSELFSCLSRQNNSKGHINRICSLMNNRSDFL